MMATIAPAQLPERFTVEVTMLDIAFGRREAGNFCPIAHAVKRTLAALGVKALTLDVDDTNVDFLMRSGEDWIAYRHDARSFVRMFDSYEPVQPRVVTLQRARPIGRAA